MDAIVGNNIVVVLVEVVVVTVTVLVGDDNDTEHSLGIVCFTTTSKDFSLGGTTSIVFSGLTIEDSVLTDDDDFSLLPPIEMVSPCCCG